MNASDSLPPDVPGPAEDPAGEQNGEQNGGHEETLIESSVLRPVQLPPRPEPERRGPIPLRFVITAAVVLFVIGAIGFAAAVRAQRLQAALANFERVLVEGTPEEALAASHDLPSAILDEPGIASRVEELERRVAARAYLDQIGDFQAGLQAAKSYADRIAVCDRALDAQVQPLRVAAERARAMFHQRMKKAKTAEAVGKHLRQLADDLGEAQTLQVEPPWGRLVLARMRWRHRGRSKALADLLRAKGPDKESAASSLVSGMLSLARQKPQMALTEFSQTLHRDPRLVDGLIMRGQLRMDRGNVKAALQDATRARELDPLSAEAWLLLAEVEFRRGKSEQARSLVADLLRANPWDAFGLGF